MTLMNLDYPSHQPNQWTLRVGRIPPLGPFLILCPQSGFCTISHCDKKSAFFIPQKSILWYISKNYLTTNHPFDVRIQKKFKSGKYIVRIRIPDPEFRKFETNFFLNCIVVNIFHETNFSLKWFLLWVALWNRPHL